MQSYDFEATKYIFEGFVMLFLSCKNWCRQLIGSTEIYK